MQLSGYSNGQGTEGQQNRGHTSQALSLYPHQWSQADPETMARSSAEITEQVHDDKAGLRSVWEPGVYKRQAKCREHGEVSACSKRIDISDQTSARAGRNGHCCNGLKKSKGRRITCRIILSM